jgi:hypothetical protein
MKKRRTPPAVPIPVARALRKLGHDIRDARRRRRIPVAILAERASISRVTLADPTHDAVGRELEEEQLPERIRLSGRQKPPKSGEK